MASDFKESDLYLPVKQFFEEKGYKVHSEVKNCDLTAVKGEELIIGEIKKSFNMTLLYQLIDRQKISETVFAIIPRPAGRRNRDFDKMRHVLKTFNFGLITVAMDSPMRYVEVLMVPEDKKTRQNSKKRTALLKELQGRTEDANTGGTNKVKIMTAYREHCIKLACILEAEGDCASAMVKKKYDFEKDIATVLRMNLYGWFEKKGRGIYGLSEKGQEALKNPEFPKVFSFYRAEVEKINEKI